MNVLVENGLAIGIIGAVACTAALVFFLARRTGGSLAVLAGVLAATCLLLVVEKLVETDRELVATAVDEIYAAVRSNDVPGVLALVIPDRAETKTPDPVALRLRSDIQTLMPMIKVEKANPMGTVEIEVDAASSPPTAVSTSNAFLDGVHGSSGMRVAYFNQRVDLRWVKQGEKWLLDGYTAYYDGQPIDAVGSARSNRAVR